jgi:hypothetical protein
MDALLENRNVVGYVLLVALAALLILRLQASRRRSEDDRARRRPAAERLAALRAQPDPEEARSLKAPGKRLSFGEARVQLYVMIAAVLALAVAYLAHHLS